MAAVMRDGESGARSFRVQLAVRIGNAFTAALLVAALVVHISLKRILIREVDKSLSSVASVQAGAIAQSPADDMQLHEWSLSPQEAETVRDINWFIQVWDEEGNARLRTNYLDRDLPVDSAAFARAQAGELSYATQEWGRGDLRTLYYPLDRIDPRHVGHVLQVASSLIPVRQTMRRVDIVLGILAILTIAAAAGGGWLLAGHALGPVQRITQEAEGIEAGSLDRRITAHARTAEFQGLVAVLNRMLERLESAFTNQKRFIADASHELRSPIAAVRGHLEVVRRRERSEAEYREAIDVALEEVSRLQGLAEGLLTLARQDAGVLEPRMRVVKLRDVVEPILASQQRRAQEKDIEIAADFAGDAVVFADPELLGRIARNLVENAISYTRPRDEVIVSTGDDEDTAWLEVADSGPGIAAEHLPHVFERFYRGDEARERTGGAGLGLAIARAIAEAHGGQITVGNRPGGGAVFRLELQAASSGLKNA